MIVAELTGLGAKSEVGGLREFDGFCLEAFGPLIRGFVLEVDL